MNNNIYDIMNKLNSLQQSEVTETETKEVNYEEVDPRGSISDVVKSLANKYENFVAEENQKLDERQFSDKDSFDKLAEPGDTYKTADGGTVTKTEKGIKHSAPSGKYGAGPEDEKDELDENTSENTLEENKELRNHPIYTNEEAWDHYQKEIAEQEAEKEELVDIEEELAEINRLAGLAEKVGGNKVKDFVDDIKVKKDKDCKEGFDPESYDKEIEYEFAGDDGEPGYGHVQCHVNVVDGRPVVDPTSLKATCNGDGNNKLTDEWCSEMVAPGGSEHEEALKACQEECDDEWESRDVDIPMDEEQLEEGPTRKDFQMVADLLKNIEDEDKKKELANHHADTFAKQNPRFDRTRFLSAVGLNEEEVEEGNEFTKARLDAIEAGKDEFELDGKTYKVTGDTEEEKMNEDKQVNEDINVNVTANGEEDALKLMMRLAGVQAVTVQQEEVVEEERDIEYANTPDEKTAPVSAAIPSGDDLHKSKVQDPETANKAANPLAESEEETLEESLWTEYEEMINDIKS